MFIIRVLGWIETILFKGKDILCTASFIYVKGDLRLTIKGDIVLLTKLSSGVGVKFPLNITRYKNGKTKRTPAIERSDFFHSVIIDNSAFIQGKPCR